MSSLCFSTNGLEYSVFEIEDFFINFIVKLSPIESNRAN